MMNTCGERSRERRQGGMSDGGVLIGLGLFFLLLVAIGKLWLALPLLGIGLLLRGIVTREAGPLVPGGILSGLGLGLFLGKYSDGLVSDGARGAAFMFGFALGWVSIAILAKLFTREPQPWALIPAGVMALVGCAALGIDAALVALRLIGYAWPVGLVAAGLYAIYRRRGARA